MIPVFFISLLTNQKRICLAVLFLVPVFLNTASLAYTNELPTGGELPAPDYLASYQTAPVIIDGTILFRVFGVSSYPASRRAEEIARRIRIIAEDPSFDPATLKIREESDGTILIYAGKTRLLAVFQQDANIEGDISPKTLAQDLFLEQIQQAIKSYREDREPKTIRKNIIRALIWIAILGILLFGLFWSFKKTDQYLDSRFKRTVKTIEEKSKRILQARQIWTILQVVIRVVRAVLVLGLLYIFTNKVLGLFPWTRNASKILLSYVINPLVSIGDAVINYLPNLFFLALLYIIVRVLMRMTHAFFNEVERRRIIIPSFYAEWAWPTYRIIRIILIMFGLVVAYPYIPGSGTEAFRGISIFAGVLLSFGSTSLIANIIAGYTMIYRRPFKIGDWVKIGNNVGKVTEIRNLVTHVRSVKNEEIVIPNSTILNGEVTNYSTTAATEGLILHTDGRYRLRGSLASGGSNAADGSGTY